MAERMFIVDARLPGSAVTYEHMYTLRHNALLEAHELLGRVRRLLRDERLLHDERLSRAVALLDAEMSSDDEPEASEEEWMDDDPVVESMAESMLARVSPGWQPFSGRGSRLD